MNQNDDNSDYRDHLSTVGKDGKRIWVYPKMPKGIFYNWRKILSYFFLIFLFAAPHIKIGGQPMLLFNFMERKFIIMGSIFWPQDFHLFAIAMITGVVFIILFTVLFGRIFCGWICPQTIFMELVFRRVEYFIEGDRTKQIKLNKAPWNKDKILKKTIKHIIFWGISFLIANTFLAYIVGAEKLWLIQIENPMEHLTGLIAIIIFTTVFYLVFSQLREQVCTTICPYGRLQGVLLDSNSIIVAYDHKRGNSRGKIKKGEDRVEAEKGDCIDCNQCVVVCPTGIDIRNGTQLECINCTACMDACDSIMDKVGFEKGLIRYASENSIKDKVEGHGFKWTARSISYVAVLTFLVVFLTYLTITRSSFEATITRKRGTLAIPVGKTHLANSYNLSLVNKTFDKYDVSLKILKGNGTLDVQANNIIHIKEQATNKTILVLTMDKKDIKPGKNVFLIGVYKGDELIEKVKTIFLGPLF